MPRMTMAEAIRETLDAEMARDERVILIGEDVGPAIMGATAGLLAKYGPERVIDTPISESAFLGMAVGAATRGMRPVVELMFCDFLGVGFDPILNQAAKLRYMSGGRVEVPLVIRTTIGAGDRAGPQHSQSLHHLFTSIPGLKCALPGCPRDAMGLLRAAIRDPDPVILCENKILYDLPGDVPDGETLVPLGRGRIVREGTDLTIVAFSRMVAIAEEAARRLRRDGLSAEVIDPRSTQPLDRTLILKSLAKTGRLLVADEGAARCGLAADIVALAATEAFEALKAPPIAITPPHAPIPFAPTLEDAWLPGADAIVDAARTLFGKD